MAKIQIGKAQAATAVADQMENSGFAFGRNEAGESVLTVKFPGVEAMELTDTALEDIRSTLMQGAPTGDAPEEVFERSAQRTAEGGLSARFSDAKRSRSVSFSATDCQEVADLILTHLNNWHSYSAQLAEVEAEAEGS